MRISRVQFRPADSLSRSYHINLETLTGADTRKTRCTKLSWEIQQMSLAAEARQRPHEGKTDNLFSLFLPRYYQLSPAKHITPAQNH